MDPGERVVVQEQVHVAVRPIVHALAFADGDADQLALAMRAATSLWGGQRFPIVPVREDGSLAPGYLEITKILDPDDVIDFSGRLLQPIVLSKGRQLMVRTAPPLTATRAWQPPPIVSHSVEEMAQLSFSVGDPADSFLTCALGSFGEPREETEEWGTYGAEITVVTGESSSVEVVAPQIQGLTALNVTIHGASTHQASAPFMRSLVMLHVLPDDLTPVDELVWFWNLRALRPGEEGASILARDSQLRDREVLDLIRSVVRSRAACQPALVVNSLSVPKRRLAGLVRSLGMERHKGSQWTESLNAHIEGRVPMAVVNVDVRGFWTGERRVGSAQTVLQTMFSPSTTLHFASPLKFAPGFTGSGRVAIRLTSSAFRGPHRTKTAGLYAPNAEWRNESLQLVTNLYSEYEFALNSPDDAAILLASVVGEYTLSDKGRELAALVRRVSDLGMFRNPLCHAAIQVLTPKDSRHLRQVAKTLSPGDSKVLLAAAALLGEKLGTLGELTAAGLARSKEATREQVSAALDTLVGAGLVERGFQVRCPICSVHSFRRFRDSPAVPLCDGCGSRALYWASSVGEPQLFYRLNSLIRRISANGGLVVLAALAVLTDEGAYCLPGVDLLTPAGSAELDLLGWAGAELHAGEAKMTHRGFTDVNRDLRASVLVGADIHLAICLDHMPASKRKLIAEEGHRAGLQVRILDAGDLLLPMDKI